jgi:DNA polymerase-3 subunit beta
MKIEILQENLQKALITASRFISARAQLPVLANIYLKATKNKVIIASTNLEISISISTAAKIKEEGEITVPAKAITEVVSHLLSGTISLHSEKEQLKIEAQGTTLNLAGMNTSDFPSIPQKMSEKGSIVLPKEELLSALNQVLFATSIDETRPILTGVLFLFQKERLILVSTDGFRLSQKKMSLKGSKRIQKAILPKSALVEVLRAAGEEEEIPFYYGEKENQATFGLSDAVLSTRILEGEFPDFEKILPKGQVLKIELDKEDFLRAIKLASTFARDSANIVKLDVLKSSVKVFAESSQAGSQETEIEAKVEGAPLEIAFNYRFLEELLQAVKGETLKVALSGPNSPGVFSDPKDLDFVHLIMPVRTQG